MEQRDKFSESFGIIGISPLSDTSQLDTKEIAIESDIQKEADDFDRLMLLMKEKLNNNSFKTIQKA